MDRQVLLDLYDREIRIDIEIPGVRKELFPGLIRMIRPAPGMNYILYSQLEPGKLDEVIEEQTRYFQKYDQPFTWQVFEHDQPPGLTERLIAHGYQPDDEPDAVLILDLSSAGPELLQPVHQNVRRLTQVEQLKDVAAVEQRVLGGDFGWLERRLAAHLDVPDYLSVYAVYDDEKPVCTGWVYFHPGSQFVGLFGGATDEQFRGQGLYRAIVAARVREAIRRDRRFVVTGASEMSRPILTRLGFQLLTTERDYVWPRE